MRLTGTSSRSRSLERWDGLHASSDQARQWNAQHVSFNACCGPCAVMPFALTWSACSMAVAKPGDGKDACELILPFVWSSRVRVRLDGRWDLRDEMLHVRSTRPFSAHEIASHSKRLRRNLLHRSSDEETFRRIDCDVTCDSMLNIQLISILFLAFRSRFFCVSDPPLGPFVSSEEQQKLCGG